MPQLSPIESTYEYGGSMLDAINKLREGHSVMLSESYYRMRSEINHVDRIKNGITWINRLRELIADPDYASLLLSVTHLFKRANQVGGVTVQCNLCSPHLDTHGLLLQTLQHQIGTESLSIYSDLIQFYISQLDHNANILILDGSVWQRRHGDLGPTFKPKKLFEKVKVFYPNMKRIADLKYIVIPMHDEGMHWRGSLFSTHHKYAYLITCICYLA